MNKQQQRMVNRVSKATVGSSDQHVHIIFSSERSQQRKGTFLPASVLSFVFSWVLQAADGEMKGEAPPHQHLGGISVNRDGSEGLEGKVNNVRNRIWSLLTVQRLPLQVGDCESEAACWIIQYYGWLGCLELSSCQKVSPMVMSYTKICIQDWRFTSQGVRFKSP